MPTVYAVEVVRCEDCKHCDPENHHCDHQMSTSAPLSRKPDDFCSYGERKDGRVIMGDKIRICAICGRAIYDSEPKIASKPHKGKTVYGHTKCVYAPTKCKGGAPIGKTKESR